MFRLTDDVSAGQIERAASIFAVVSTLPDADRAKCIKRLLTLSAGWDTGPISARKLLTLEQFLRTEHEVEVLKEASQTIQIACQMLRQSVRD